MTKKIIKYFSAFTGIAGFEIAMPKEWECVGYSEVLEPAIKIINKHFPNHKNYGDITKINADDIPDFDLFVGGFPCQDLSVAGKQRGLQGERSGLFFEIVRILKVKKPTYLLLENVRNLLAIQQGGAFKTILRTLSELGYDCEWAVFYSQDFGKPQSRPRVYIKGVIRASEQEVNAGKGQKQTAPILFNIKQGFRNTDYNWDEISRMPTEIIRSDAGISIGLDGRITKDDKEVFTGECDNTDNIRTDI